MTFHYNFSHLSLRLDANPTVEKSNLCKCKN
jgi:hypothetical protein